MRKHILLVDDDELQLWLTKKYLQKLNTDVEVFDTTSPREALSILRNKEFDIIISDFMMPEMNGIELLEAIRKEGHQTHFIIHTGHPLELIESTAIACGAQSCHRKDGTLSLFKHIVTIIENLEETRIQDEIQDTGKTISSCGK